MTKPGIRYQILLASLVPVLLVDILFTSVRIANGIDQQRSQLHDRGLQSARQVAARLGDRLAPGDEQYVRGLLDQAISSDDIVSATVYDRHGRRVSSSAAADFDSRNSSEYLYVRQPVMSAAGAGEPDLAGTVTLYLSRQQLRQQNLQIITEAGVLFVLVLVAAAALAAVFSRRITQPIFALTEHLRQVESGQLGRTIQATGANEIGDLQKGFNRLTQALLASRRHLDQRIQQTTQRLNEDIGALESKNRELEFARDLAQDANRKKSEFLARMSHEIRTPINGIKGFIGLLGQSSLDPSQRRYVDIIGRSTRDLGGIVDEILDFSKMESGKLHIVDEDFDLHEVIEQTRDILFINALAKEIDLNLIIFSDTPRRVRGDKLRLKQILINLIGNAIKFTDQGRVVVRVSTQDLRDGEARVLISVEDSGIGISERDQQSLFQAFSQVDSTDTRCFNGTGLGLVISRNLAGLMGGTVTMQSTPGKGSRFDLNLPFRLADPSGGIAEPAADAMRAFVVAARHDDLMEIRTLYDRAGAITEAEVIDADADDDTVLGVIRRNLNYIDLLAIDLRHLQIDPVRLLQQLDAGTIRVVLMHYDSCYKPPSMPDNFEFVSIVNTGNDIARILKREPGEDEALFSAAAATPEQAQRRKVLLVDDNQVNLKLASELMRLWGHEVREVDNADSAFALYRQETFDLVILDIQMPHTDGVGLMRMMRDHRPHDKAPMVALTANVLEREAERLLELGFDYFIAKPVDEDRFRALLDGQLDCKTGPAVAAHASAASSAADCSLDYARSLELSAGNEALLRQILEILRRDIPEQQRQLREAYHALDHDRLGALAHKLHGVTCYASLPRLRRIVLAFEQQLGDVAGKQLQALVEELQNELDAVKAEVDGYLRRLGPAALPS